MAANPNARLEAFCDGVFAIALTLLIIEIKPPAGEHIETSRDLWLALKHLLPSIFAFVLSFGIILITWVSHHEGLKLVDKSSPQFIFANGFLLLSVVFVPFPTALLGENLLTTHAAPAVVLYSATGAFQAIGWTLIGWTALGREPLTRSERATARMRKNVISSYFAIAFYTACAIVAVWRPLTIAAVITVMWTYWAIYSMRTARDSRED